MQHKITYPLFVLLLAAAALALGSPAAVRAAYNDVTFPNDTLIHIDSVGIDLTVLNGGTVETVTVTSSSVSFGMQSGSVVTVRSLTRNNLNNDLGVFTCSTANSEVTLTSTQAQTLNLTPTSAVCTIPNSGGGGGGGGGVYIPPAATSTAVTASTTPVTTPVTTSASAVTPQVATPVAVQTAAPSVGQTISQQFTARLRTGAKGDEVRRLQGLLAGDGVYSGAISGYFGALTKKAVQRFQEKYGIAKSGNVGYGEVGPSTRAKLNQLIAGSVAAPAPASTPASSPAQGQSAEVKAQIQLLQDQLAKLLAALAQALQAQVQELQK